LKNVDKGAIQPYRYRHNSTSVELNTAMAIAQGIDGKLHMSEVESSAGILFQSLSVQWRSSPQEPASPGHGPSRAKTADDSSLPKDQSHRVAKPLNCLDYSRGTTDERFRSPRKKKIYAAYYVKSGKNWVAAVRRDHNINAILTMYSRYPQWSPVTIGRVVDTVGNHTQVGNSRRVNEDSQIHGEGYNESMVDG
jgi:hypothetical protein